MEEILEVSRAELEKMAEKMAMDMLGERSRKAKTAYVWRRAQETQRSGELINKGNRGTASVGSKPPRPERFLESRILHFEKEGDGDERYKEEEEMEQADREELREQVKELSSQLARYKTRGATLSAVHMRGSPFSEEILKEVVTESFQIRTLPKYDGTRDPQEHVTAFDHIMQLYCQSEAINTRVFVTTLTGRAQEWFVSLPRGTFISYEHLIRKFNHQFSSKSKSKRTPKHLFGLRQGKNEPLNKFMDRFLNETLDVQELGPRMMNSILMMALRPGPFASAIAREAPTTKDEMVSMSRMYIREEEMNYLKEKDWGGGRRHKEPKM